MWRYNGIEASQVEKIDISQTIKIELKSCKMAKRVIEEEIYIFNISLCEIEAENYIDVIVCMRFYKLGDHHKDVCPKAADYICCSECAGEGHTYIIHMYQWN